MEYLINVDLEGVHGVVGEPYLGLIKTIPEYKKAVSAAAKEINAAAKALFDAGADRVSVWDNHGGSGNIDFADLDPRIEEIRCKDDRRRYDFVRSHAYDGVLFLGYHAREGTLNGVLAHSFSSVSIQYIKINGIPVGEMETDSWILASHGIPTLFFASDEQGILQARAIGGETETVITKYGTSRNTAVFRDADEVLGDIYNGVKRAVTLSGVSPVFPAPAKAELRYTRMEAAAEVYARIKAEGEIPVEYGDDAHILRFTLQNANDIPHSLG